MREFLCFLLPFPGATGIIQEILLNTPEVEQQVYP